MLFDLSNPRRKNVIRVVYAFLAVIFAGGFIGFGIGTEGGGGGLFEGIFGDGGGGSTADQYEQQIEDAEDRLETDPNDQGALSSLAQYRFLSGAAQLERDESTGQPTGLTDEARGEFEEAISAWNRYLDADPRKVDVSTATNVATAYEYVGDYQGAADAQELLVKRRPITSYYVKLAFYHYLSLDLKAGDKAGEKALEVAKPDQRKEAKPILDQYRKGARQLKKQQKNAPDAATGEGGGIADPFGGLAPQGGAGLPPQTP